MEARQGLLAKPFTFFLLLASSFIPVQSARAQSFNVIHNFTGGVVEALSRPSSKR